MTAPDTTQPFNVERYRKHTWQYTIASINTSVDVRVEGSLDNNTWGNVNAADATTQKTANGTYLMWSEIHVRWIRFVFVSEAGGTAATINVKYKGGQ